jgi:hypothetical protein
VLVEIRKRFVALVIPQASVIDLLLLEFATS